MNVREEDRQKNSCPSRGLGLAAAAIGVGVGAALYYFFSKRPENPDGEGSTTGWSCEQPHALDQLHENEDTDSYTTISENSTTDTSMYTSDESDTDINETSYDETSSGNESEMFSWWHRRGSSTSFTDSDSDIDDRLTDISGDTSYSVNRSHTANANVTSIIGENTLETGYLSLPTINASHVGSDSDTLDWDVTNSSMGVPNGATVPSSPLMTLFSNIGAYISPRPLRSRRTTEEEQMMILRDQALSEEEQLKILRQQAYRERTWSLEECSICFDVILKDQQVTTLPCTHHFHSDCIAPWLQEQQTCPNCRKAAE